MTVWTCLCAGDILLRREGDTLSLPIGDLPPVALQPWNRVTTIGQAASDDKSSDVAKPPQDGRSSCMTMQVVHLDSPVVGIEGLEMMGLRASYDVLSPNQYNLAGKAAELIYWHQNSKYCGCCGAPMKFHTAISKRCTNCGKELWPQLATAVIVRVTRNVSKDSAESRDGSEILLVHANNFRKPYYGLVAGFVETGETLEEAVRREVREETGLEITNIRYFASQPWPYPCGLMVGFTADYVTGDIRLQREELSSGGWFTRTNLPAIPGRASIARRLIDDWVNAPSRCSGQ